MPRRRRMGRGTVRIDGNIDDSEKRSRRKPSHRLFGIGPKDELEGMMAAQLIAAHNAGYRRATSGPPPAKSRGR